VAQLDAGLNAADLCSGDHVDQRRRRHGTFLHDGDGIFSMRLCHFSDAAAFDVAADLAVVVVAGIVVVAAAVVIICVVDVVAAAAAPLLLLL